ncbi:diguanylate cyclase [Rhizobium sp. LjRoot30]|uniref:sensor domain-containing diguanylate cyclase n=1 Tax=Rhizobium sp. LjRoot30 TaxID=3342320 RepID=UPI003ED0A44D
MSKASSIIAAGTYLAKRHGPANPETAGTCSALPDALLAGFAASGAAIALFDPADRLVFTSEGMRRIYNIQPDCASFDDIMRHCHASRTGPRFSTDIEVWLDNARQKRRGAPHRTFEIDMVDGRWFWASETTYDRGWVLLFVTDITQLKTNESLLRLARDAAQQAADTDALTGLLNRRHVMSVFSYATLDAGERGTALSVALIDLDHFKTINDRFGHAAGDKVLCHFADLARQKIRDTDTLARIGGEEFMLMMPGVRLQYAIDIVERIRESVSLAAPVAGIDLSYTLSAGIAECIGECPDELFQRADKALYRAKQNGRNRTETAR